MEKALTSYRIVEALYTKPYTYQRLWRITKIHRNTLKRRLDELIDRGIIIRHHYTFPNYRGKYIGRDFYLLDWGNTEAKAITSHIFNKQLAGNSVLSMSSRISSLTYKINSIQIKGSKKEYITIRENRLNLPVEFFSISEFVEKVKELKMKEKNIFKEIRHCVYTTGSVRQRNKLIEKRDTVLESLVSLCTRFCANKYLENNSDLSPYDMLIFFTTLSLFDYWRPYTKFFEIMVRMGH